MVQRLLGSSERLNPSGGCLSGSWPCLPDLLHHLRLDRSMLLELRQQGGEAIALQLMTERAVDVARKSPRTGHLASFGDHLFFKSEGDFLDVHASILLQVGFRSTRVK